MERQRARKAASVEHPIDAHVGRRLREERLTAGLSQEKLAEKVGVTFQQIQKYERGENRISAARLYDVAQAMGVSIESLYGDEQDWGSLDGHNRRVQSFVRRFRQLTDYQQRSLNDLMKAMISHQPREGGA
jgi:transcriptional regulator with XRE-family HTH domain